ncbi:MAG: murein biosynthesis integral membrane protein MurJ [Planctomycetes bacterium]|nr:murein biosynthesis integral membrane protein MurJ [Planctomycetota bacterium]
MPAPQVYAASGSRWRLDAPRGRMPIDRTNDTDAFVIIFRAVRDDQETDPRMSTLPPPTGQTGPAASACSTAGPVGNVVRNAKRIAGITLASRVFGMVRDIALAAWLGNSMVQDRFTYGFMIANVFRRLFGEGALSAAFVPTLSEALAREGVDQGRRLYAAVATLLAVALAVVTLVVEIGLVVALLLGSGRGSYRLGVGLTAAMFPFMPFICTTALMASCLNVLGRFNWPAAMPIVMNVIQIACIFWIAPHVPGGPERQVYVLAVAVVLSGVAQTMILGTQLRRLGYSWTFVWLPHHPGVRRMFATMAPAILGLGALQLAPVIDGQIILWLSSAGEQQTVHVAGRVVSCPLDEGSQSSVAQAQRLYQFPLGVLAISLASAVFPALARHAADQDFAAMRQEVSRSVRLAIFEGLPAGVGLIVLAEPITRLLFEHGAYKAIDTARTAWVLRFFAAGLWAFCAQHMLLRGFYAMHDTRTPLKVSLALVASTVVLNLLGVWTPLGVGTFGLTTAVTSGGSVVLLALLLRRKLAGRLDLRAILRSIAKTAAATAAMSVAAALALHYGHSCWGAPTTFGHYRNLICLLDVFVPMVLGSVAFLTAAFALRSTELKELLGSTRK